MAKQKSGGCKKQGRAKKRKEARNKPLSLFVRGKISAAQYFALTGQKIRK